MNSSFKPKREGIGISFPVSRQANDILTESAKRAERPKRREAKLRLEDHLKRFPDWKQ